MKWFSFVATGLLAAAFLVGGTGCLNKEKKSAVGEGGKKLSVNSPGDTSVKPGETATINVDITREKFNDPVELRFTGLPDGVSIMENDLTISKDVRQRKLLTYRNSAMLDSCIMRSSGDAGCKYCRMDS